MPTYRIENSTSGHVFGDYEGETGSEAIRAMLADAGSDEEPGDDVVAREVRPAREVFGLDVLAKDDNIALVRDDGGIWPVRREGLRELVAVHPKGSDSETHEFERWCGRRNVQARLLDSDTRDVVAIEATPRQMQTSIEAAPEGHFRIDDHGESRRVFVEFY